jgi:hypothetical protein
VFGQEMQLMVFGVYGDETQKCVRIDVGHPDPGCLSDWNTEGENELGYVQE